MAIEKILLECDECNKVRVHNYEKMVFTRGGIEIIHHYKCGVCQQEKRMIDNEGRTGELILYS